MWMLGWHLNKSGKTVINNTSHNNTCPSCEQPLLGQYCHLCGEKQFKNSDISAQKVSSHIFSSVTEVDGKLLTSLRLLLIKPGRLTIDYLSGVRKNRLSPFQLLLLINIIFFLMAAYLGHSSFTTRLAFHTNSSNFIHQPVAKKMVESHLESSKEPREAYTNRFNAMVEVQAKSLVMLMVPMLALIIWLLYPKQSYPVVSSLIFATHLFAYMLLVNTFVAPVLSKLMAWLVISLSIPINEDSFEWVFSALLFSFYGVYFYLAAHNAYQGNAVINGIKSVVFVAAVYWVYLIYRMVLFFTTFYAL